MYGYKSAVITRGEKSVSVALTLTGDWKSSNHADHNWAVGLDGQLETALSRALESQDGVGLSRDNTVTVVCSK